MPSIDRTSPEPFYQQIYEQVVAGIESGLHPAGKRLPSIRECARELGVSSSTIELAYQRLVAEGYIEAKRGSGHIICAVDSAPRRASAHTPEYTAALAALARMDADDVAKPRYDFAYDRIDAETFPLVTWARICREVFFDEGAERSCLYDDAQGLPALREEIAKFVNNEQGTDWTPDQVLVMPTTRDLIEQILSLFDPAETPIAMEEPGYDEVASAIRRNGFGIRPVPVHPALPAESLLRAAEGARIAFITPASQFPTNAPMPASSRRELVKWAQQGGSYIVDDEYGWELQSGIARMPSLAALDRDGRVIVTGTFSNTFTPAICLSYALLPPQLMARWRNERRGVHPRVPWQTQAAMASFMRQGHWNTHLRKLRTTVQRKRAILLDAFEEQLGDTVDVVNSAGSQFVLVKARDGRNEDELIEAAAREGARVYPTSRYWTTGSPANWRYVLVGFAGISVGDIEPGIRALARAWR